MSINTKADLFGHLHVVPNDEPDATSNVENDNTERVAPPQQRRCSGSALSTRHQDC